MPRTAAQPAIRSTVDPSRLDVRGAACQAVGFRGVRVPGLPLNPKPLDACACMHTYDKLFRLEAWPSGFVS